VQEGNKRRCIVQAHILGTAAPEILYNNFNYKLM
jgi:hypothetical protein